jgi:hypothetical protein
MVTVLLTRSGYRDGLVVGSVGGSPAVAGNRIANEVQLKREQPAAGAIPVDTVPMSIALQA